MENMDKTVIETAERSKSNTHRIDKLERSTEAVQALALSVQKIAINTETIAKEQREQGERLEQLENKPAERIETIIKSVLTTLTGAGIGAVIALIFK